MVLLHEARSDVIALQIKRAFLIAWDAAAGQLTNPRASAEDLELAQVEAEDAWRQLQTSSGIATGSEHQPLEATKFALSKGIIAISLFTG